MTSAWHIRFLTVQLHIFCSHFNHSLSLPCHFDDPWNIFSFHGDRWVQDTHQGVNYDGIASKPFLSATFYLPWFLVPNHGYKIIVFWWSFMQCDHKEISELSEWYLESRQGSTMQSRAEILIAFKQHPASQKGHSPPIQSCAIKKLFKIYFSTN